MSLDEHCKTLGIFSLLKRMILELLRKLYLKRLQLHTHIEKTESNIT